MPKDLESVEYVEDIERGKTKKNRNDAKGKGCYRYVCRKKEVKR